MMKTKSLFLLTFGTATLGFGQWTLIDDFEDGTVEDWSGESQNLQDGTHSEFQGVAEAVADPIGGNDTTVGKFSGGPEEGDNFGGAVGHAIDLPQPVAPDGVVTVYYKLGVGMLEQDSIFGVTPTEDFNLFWGDLEAIFRVANLNYAFDIYNEVGYESFGFPYENQWYHVWMVLDNGADTYRLYIQGSPDYPEQTQAVTFEGNDEFIMRVRSDGELNRFAIVQNIGTVEVPISRDPIYLDDLFIDYSGENLTVPSGGTQPEMWGPFEVETSGWVDSGDFFGWFRPIGDYAFVQNLGRYIYLPPATASASGAWGFVDGAPSEWGESSLNGWHEFENFLGWVYPVGDYVYSQNLNQYLYLPEANLASGGSWIWVSF